MVISTDNFVDGKGNPNGGYAIGSGFTISWQSGPLGPGENRKEPNGAFITDVIHAVIQRLEFFQESTFICDENSEAIGCLISAVTALQSRTARRELEGTEGTHEGW